MVNKKNLIRSLFLWISIEFWCLCQGQVAQKFEMDSVRKDGRIDKMGSQQEKMWLEFGI